MPNFSILRSTLLAGLLALLVSCGGGGGTSPVPPAPTPPTLTAHPANATVTAPATASFTVAATGTAPLAYQWQVNPGSGWTTVAAGSGGTTATYTTTATTAGDHGSQFRVLVSNSAGSATSNPATLTVNAAPAITAQPSNATVTAPGTATFTVAATGTAPLAYQWQVNNGGAWANVITGSGGTTAAYTTAATTAGDHGRQFRVLVSNAFGGATSSAATLSVLVPPVITAQPASATVLAPAAGTFAVTATGQAPLSYQWQVNTGGGWGNVSTGSGGTTAAYTTAATAFAQNGAQFRVLVSNAAGSTTSSPAILTVNSAPVFTAQPQPVWVTATGTAFFFAATTGNAPMTFQWRRNGATIPGAVNASYTTPATVAGDNGALYSVAVTNAHGTTVSSAAALTVAAVAAVAPDATRERWTPTVVPETHTQPVKVEFTVTGAPAWAVLQVDNVDRRLADDGTGGDSVAGDGVWTLMLDPSLIIGKNTAAAVHRPFIGFLKVAGLAGRFNVFAEVWTSALGSPPVFALDASGQETDYIANYVATGSQIVNFDPKVWAQRFYQHHGDTFDFLNFVTVAGLRGNRYHAGVRSAVAGIGQTPYDFGPQFGSANRLKGYTVFPVVSMYDLGGPVFSHETGHQWINFLNGTAYGPSVPHWPPGNIAVNVMGLSIPGSNAGGAYAYSFTPNGTGGYLVGNPTPLATSTFNTMELYLMGMATAAEVGPYFILNNPNQTLAVGQTLTAGEITTVTIGQITAAKGARSPDAATAQRDFRCATIILSEQLLPPASLALYDFLARRAEAKQTLTFADGLLQGTCNPWFLATGGRSTMTSKIR
jgi:hypothetical protein